MEQGEGSYAMHIPFDLLLIGMCSLRLSLGFRDNMDYVVVRLPRGGRGGRGGGGGGVFSA